MREPTNTTRAIQPHASKACRARARAQHGRKTDSEGGSLSRCVNNAEGEEEERSRPRAQATTSPDERCSRCLPRSRTRGLATKITGPERVRPAKRAGTRGRTDTRVRAAGERRQRRRAGRESAREVWGVGPVARESRYTPLVNQGARLFFYFLFFFFFRRAHDTRHRAQQQQRLPRHGSVTPARSCFLGPRTRPTARDARPKNSVSSRARSIERARDPIRTPRASRAGTEPHCNYNKQFHYARDVSSQGVCSACACDRNRRAGRLHRRH